MKIAVVGAAGMAGSRVVAEAARRGHEVIAVHRGTAPPLPSGVLPVRADAADRDRLAGLFRAVDAVVGATRPREGQEDTVGPTTAALLDAAVNAGRRILFIGGAGPLRTDADGLVVDDPRYVPARYRTIAAASVAQLRVCEAHAADWVYLSPPALLEPGSRLGTYRRGGTVLVTAPDGSSRISAEDLAVAVLDELEEPGDERHFGVGY
ncbi:NAD(P)-dependent oxidoreductase [Amycolatopsis magusensis]|uniref:NAD(P)-dependent oxidoreductase n=1 Tax=Amycolatopsis magusensis TaxID=882444 RepID=UPI003C2D49AB